MIDSARQAVAVEQIDRMLKLCEDNPGWLSIQMTTRLTSLRGTLCIQSVQLGAAAPNHVDQDRQR